MIKMGIDECGPAFYINCHKLVSQNHLRQLNRPGSVFLTGFKSRGVARDNRRMRVSSLVKGAETVNRHTIWT